VLLEGRWDGGSIIRLPPWYRARCVSQALGRVIAHEMGHLLLHSSAHSDRGLMRQWLTVSDLMALDLHLFRLQPAEVRLLEGRTAACALVQAPTRPAESRTGSARSTR